MSNVHIAASAGGMVKELLSDVTVVGSGASVPMQAARKVIEATVTGTGALTATVEIYGNTRDDTTGGILLATITLAGTTSARDGFASDAPWPHLYAVVPVGGITGTGATLNVDVAY